MNRIITLVLCILVIGVSARAAEKDTLRSELKAAGQITDSDARLQSYDSILEKYSLRKKTDKGDDNNWIVSVDADPMDDSKVITFVSFAVQGKSKWGKPIMLVIRKSGDDMELYVNWEDYLGSEVVVSMRVGTNGAKTEQWSISSDSQASFYTGDVPALVSQMMRSDKMVFRCTPYNESPVTAEFDIRGLKKELEKYKDDFAAVYKADELATAAPKE